MPRIGNWQFIFLLPLQRNRMFQCGMETPLGLAILIGVFVVYKIDFIASLLNLKNLTPEIPSEFVGVYEADRYSKSQEYTRASTKYSIIHATFSLMLLIAFWAMHGFGLVDDLVRSWNLNPTLTGILYIGILFIGSWLIHLPFQIHDTFVIEEKFGFNKTTPKLFVIDQIKTLLLSAILGGAILALIIWIFQNVSHAWLWAWGAFTGISLLLTYFAPSLILPIFNKFQPMEENELKRDIYSMAKKCEFPLTEIHVMDGSKRSTKSNAFFTGLGKKKKIALFDTLIEKQSNDELVAVLAHEIGHFKKKHIIQRIVISIIQSAVIFFLLDLITNPEGAFAKALFKAFYLTNEQGSPIISIYVGLVLFTILFKPISTILGILSSSLSRKHEFEADEYAARAQGSSSHLISALKKLASDNLSNLTPHPFKVMLEYSHPPLIERINALKNISFK